MHIYSTLFIAQTVDEELRTEEGLKKAVDWCRASKLHKVYIESFRDGLFVDKDLLIKVRDRFVREGFTAHGCVTTSHLPKPSNNWPDACCYTNRATREMLREIFERTAEVFDVIMVDDFLFTDCTCEECTKAKGDRSFDDYHSDVTHEVSKEYILAPAHRVNPGCKVIIKYPLWYEDYHKNGYDTLRQTEAFDAIWIGNETREPDASFWGRFPQTNAFYVMEWANKLGHGKCLGGWFDPYSTKPETYLDQAIMTILGKSGETMLYSYDTLKENVGNPEVLDANYYPGADDTEAFRKARNSLDRLADLIENKKIKGVSVPKQPHHDAVNERFLSSYYGLIGIPVSPDTELAADAPSVILGTQAENYPCIREYIAKRTEDGKPTVITKGLEEALGITGKHVIDISENYSGKEDFDPTDCWNITRIPEDIMDPVRDYLTKPLGLVFRSPARVTLNLYDDDMEVIGNLNNEEVTVTLDLSGRDPRERNIILTLTEDKTPALSYDGKKYTLTIPARTYVVLGPADIADRSIGF